MNLIPAVLRCSFPAACRTQLVAAILATVSLAGCAVTVTENQVAYAEIKAKALSPNQVFGSVTSRLVSMGFDIKHSDRDAGVVISEYRAVARGEGNPPFDTYLQFRTTILERKDGVLVRLTPSVKSQNRLNPLASSEIPLLYYTGDSKSVGVFMKRKGAAGAVYAHSVFEDVVHEMANMANVPFEQVEQQVQSRMVKSE